MDVKVKINCNAESLIARLNSIRIVKDGKVSFGGFDYHEIIAIIATNISMNKAIPEEAKTSIVQKGIYDAAKNEITLGSLLEHLGNAEKNYLEIKPIKYSALNFERSLSA